MTTCKINDIHANTAAIGDRLGAYPAQFQTHLEHQFYRPDTIAEYNRRLSEALSLDAADVDLENGVLTLQQGKLGKARLPLCSLRS
jgi:hypothetical protein